jgi:hypothetical protein
MLCCIFSYARFFLSLPLDSRRAVFGFFQYAAGFPIRSCGAHISSFELVHIVFIYACCVLVFYFIHFHAFLFFILNPPFIFTPLRGVAEPQWAVRLKAAWSRNPAGLNFARHRDNATLPLSRLFYFSMSMYDSLVAVLESCSDVAIHCSQVLHRLFALFFVRDFSRACACDFHQKQQLFLRDFSPPPDCSRAACDLLVFSVTPAGLKDFSDC